MVAAAVAVWGHALRAVAVPLEEEVAAAVVAVEAIVVAAGGN